MTTSNCPQGHASSADDYCDVCGTAMPSAVRPPATSGAGPLTLDPPAGPAPGGPSLVPSSTVPSASASTGPACPHCGGVNAPSALFCEACGTDLTTGQAPAAPRGAGSAAGGTPSKVAAVEWVAEIWVDPDWYAHEAIPGSSVACPPAGVPGIVAIHGTSALVGRPSASRGISPDLDAGADSAVSHRHAELTLDGGHWYIEDLQSANGTRVAPAGGPFSDGPIPPGQRTLLGEDDRVYVGAWTRIVVRHATADEKGA